jgi:hypothetical protein
LKKQAEDWREDFVCKLFSLTELGGKVCEELLKGKGGEMLGWYGMGRRWVDDGEKDWQELGWAEGFAVQTRIVKNQLG